jgi:hypothetical protein
MDINMTLFAQFVFFSMFIVGGLIYYLGKQKTPAPKVSTLIGVFLCLTPLLNIIFLVVLMLKNDNVTIKNIYISVQSRYNKLLR